MSTPVLVAWGTVVVGLLAASAALLAWDALAEWRAGRAERVARAHPSQRRPLDGPLHG